MVNKNSHWHPCLSSSHQILLDSLDNMYNIKINIKIVFMCVIIIMMIKCLLILVSPLPCQGPFKCYVLQWGYGVLYFPEKNVMRVYGSTLLALRGGGWVSNFKEKSVTQHLNGPLPHTL